MDVLVVAGYCLRVNSSANLCHLSYIKGLSDLGCNIDLLTVSSRGQRVDESIMIPVGVNLFEYASSLYELMAYKNQEKNMETVRPINGANSSGSPKKIRVDIKSRVLKLVKKVIRERYGVHGTVSAWRRNAMKFKSNKEYDLVVSLAYPPISHVLVYDLARKKRIRYRHWLQIWEDPWFGDFDSDRRRKKVFKEEKRILSFAEKICYVSPITLYYQKKMFPDSSEKMFWQPLPSYYQAEQGKLELSENVYGYFGDYNPAIRNLIPFYEAAVEKNILCNICGNPTNLIFSKNRVTVYPRLNLKDLSVIENRTNVLVFLCNKKGGQIPGKIYQYSSSDKIILFILDGTLQEQKILRQYFGKYDRYIFCNNNKESIKAALDKIDRRELCGISSLPLEDFEPTVIVKKIIDSAMK